MQSIVLHRSCDGILTSGQASGEIKNEIGGLEDEEHLDDTMIH